MAITKRSVKASRERQILTGMIVSDVFLSEIGTLYDPRFLEHQYMKEVASLCLDYHSSYGKAPLENIQDLFKYAKDDMDPDVSDLVEEFLAGLSDEFEHAPKFNDEYALTQASEYLQERALLLLSEDIKAGALSGDLLEAEAALSDFKNPKRVASTGLDPFSEEAVEPMRSAFEEQADPLFRLPGAFGRLLNPHLTRNALVAFMGPEKRGKTWTMIDVAMRAKRERCNVALFAIGDMTEGQMLRRLGIYTSQRSDDPRYCGEILIPILDCKLNQHDDCDRDERECNFGIYESPESDPLDFEEATDLGYSPCTACHKAKDPSYKGAVWYQQRDRVDPLTWREARKSLELYNKRTKGAPFKLAFYPADTINMKGIEQVLGIWERNEGFIPDVILIDYADNLAPEDSRVTDMRHRENDRWKAMSRIRQERNCLLITATQADAASYTANTLGMKNFSEDKRKLAHVTAIFGLNQTAEEQAIGILRVNSIAAREGGGRTATLLQCLQIGRPCLASY